MTFSIQIPTSYEAVLTDRLYLIEKQLSLPFMFVLDSEGRNETKSNWGTAAGCCFKILFYRMDLPRQALSALVVVAGKVSMLTLA